MTSSAQQIRSYTGPAVLSFGFRPFFLLAGLWTALAMAIGIAMLSAVIAPPTAFAVIDWHVHEQLYGYLPAVIAGFLLTAVPNWTGRLPVVGSRLLMLVVLWIIGRGAVFFSAYLGPVVTAICDLAFLLALSFVIGREVVAGRNWKNLKVLFLIGLMSLGNVLFHFEAADLGAAANGIGARLGLAVTIMLIMVVGGRIVPSFTRNWLKRQPSSPPLPAPFGSFDMAALIVAGAALLLWVALPDRLETAWLCLLAGVFQFMRLSRWAGLHTGAERLVLILHIGYVFVPLGFVLVGATSLWPASLAPNAAVHAWTAGAVGVMTLAVMTRASLGHSGCALVATRGIEISYAFVVAAALLRIVGGLTISPDWLIEVAGIAWVLGFSLFVFQFAPLLLKARQCA